MLQTLAYVSTLIVFVGCASNGETRDRQIATPGERLISAASSSLESIEPEGSCAAHLESWCRENCIIEQQVEQYCSYPSQNPVSATCKVYYPSNPTNVPDETITHYCPW